MGAPLRGVTYGIGALAVPLVWAWGYRLPAVGIALMVVGGIALEIGGRLRR